MTLYFFFRHRFRAYLTSLQLIQLFGHEVCKKMWFLFNNKLKFIKFDLLINICLSHKGGTHVEDC